MVLSDVDKALVEEATRLVERRADGVRHTVAAAVRSRDGRTVAALNVYHFTGGPCAEVAALACAVSEGLDELLVIVAVGDAGRGILSPCGRCRQVLFDYFPAIRVIVTVDGEVTTIPLAHLLPFAPSTAGPSVDIANPS